MKLSHHTLQKIVDELIKWIKLEMQQRGGTKMLLGISGGKDSSVVAALGAEALGKENVLGVLMPKGEQADIDFSYEISDLLGITNVTIPIEDIYTQVITSLQRLPEGFLPKITTATTINLSPRIRMTILYAISQSIPGSRVIHTGNLSEKWVGYTTVYGDNTGAFAPLGNFTTDEVIQIGRCLEIPEKFLIKPPADGLTGKTDEMVLGFSYEILNKYIRTGEIEDVKIKERIDSMHNYNSFKYDPIPVFPNNLPVKI